MFKCTIKTGNATFEDDYRNYEVARILKEIAQKIENGRTEGKCMDINGNSVGEWSLK